LDRICQKNREMAKELYDAFKDQTGPGKDVLTFPTPEQYTAMIFKEGPRKGQLNKGREYINGATSGLRRFYDNFVSNSPQDERQERKDKRQAFYVLVQAYHEQAIALGEQQEAKEEKEEKGEEKLKILSDAEMKEFWKDTSENTARVKEYIQSHQIFNDINDSMEMSRKDLQDYFKLYWQSRGHNLDLLKQDEWDEENGFFWDMFNYWIQEVLFVQKCEAGLISKDIVPNTKLPAKSDAVEFIYLTVKQVTREKEGDQEAFFESLDGHLKLHYEEEAPRACNESFDAYKARYNKWMLETRAVYLFKDPPAYGSNELVPYSDSVEAAIGWWNNHSDPSAPQKTRKEIFDWALKVHVYNHPKALLDALVGGLTPEVQRSLTDKQLEDIYNYRGNGQSFIDGAELPPIALKAAKWPDFLRSWKAHQLDLERKVQTETETKKPSPRPIEDKPSVWTRLGRGAKNVLQSIGGGLLWGGQAVASGVAATPGTITAAVEKAGELGAVAKNLFQRTAEAQEQKEEGSETASLVGGSIYGSAAGERLEEAVVADKVANLKRQVRALDAKISSKEQRKLIHWMQEFSAVVYDYNHIKQVLEGEDDLKHDLVQTLAKTLYHLGQHPNEWNDVLSIQLGWHLYNFVQKIGFKNIQGELAKEEKVLPKSIHQFLSGSGHAAYVRVLCGICSNITKEVESSGGEDEEATFAKFTSKLTTSDFLFAQAPLVLLDGDILELNERYDGAIDKLVHLRSKQLGLVRDPRKNCKFFLGAAEKSAELLVGDDLQQARLNMVHYLRRYQRVLRGVSAKNDWDKLLSKLGEPSTTTPKLSDVELLAKFRQRQAAKEAQKQAGEQPSL
jgi:hypothetical protein